MNAVEPTVPQEFTAGMLVGGVMAGLATALIIIRLIIWVIQIVGYWKVFTKAGENGWKSIIPVYNEYTVYKLAWKPSMFWLTFLVGMAMTIFASVAGTLTGTAQVVLQIIADVLFVVMIVLLVKLNLKLSKAYGYGVPFALGLIFLWPIFILILGYGSSTYKGANL